MDFIAIDVEIWWGAPINAVVCQLSRAYFAKDDAEREDVCLKVKLFASKDLW
jgi:hypothetical protein